MTDRIDFDLFNTVQKLTADIKAQAEVFTQHNTRLLETNAAARALALTNERQRLLDQLESVDTWLLLLSCQRVHVEVLRDRIARLVPTEGDK